MTELLRAAESSFSGLHLKLEEPTPEEEAADERRFAYSEDDWTVSGHVRIEADGPKLSSLEIRPVSSDGAVNATMVRGIPVGKILASLRTLLTLDRARREGARYEVGLPPGYSYTPLTDDGSPPKRPRRGGKPTVPEELLRSLAEAYLEETAPGKPARPLSRIAERFGRPEETVRTWLARARKEGWLAPGVKGRAGGEPGPKLLAAQLAQIEGQHPGLVSHAGEDSDDTATDLSAPPGE